MSAATTPSLWVNTKVLVQVISIGGTNEDPPTLYPAVPGKVVYVNHYRSGPVYSVKLLADVPGAKGWKAGDTYRADSWQVKPNQEDRASV